MLKEKKNLPKQAPQVPKADHHQERLLTGMKRHFPELYNLLSSNQALMPFIMKYVLPYLYASGMPKQKILEIVKILMKAKPNKAFFERFAAFALKYGTPDGEAIKHFLSAEGWK
ncbi:MAG: hypothetical protein GXN92_03145 [Candidatus Micrarchaeota archaeon]|nr:hypothetical protein [Candidatus Micrarchaeota archaeon]